MDYSYLIVDSNAATSLQLRHFMEEYEDFFFLGEAQTAQEGLNSILKFRPDLVFVNLQRSANEVFEICRELSQYLEALPLIIGIASDARLSGPKTSIL